MPSWDASRSPSAAIPRNRMRMAVDGGGQAGHHRLPGPRAIRANGPLLDLDLVTGRTHQIRVHLASIGHAVAGDPIYATVRCAAGPMVSNGSSCTPGSWSSCRRGPVGWSDVRHHCRRRRSRCWSGLRAQTTGKELTIRAIEGQPGAQLVIISGPSGVGKDTIIEAMQRAHAAASAPLRRHRDHARAGATAEIDGVSYHFLSLADYERLRGR